MKKVISLLCCFVICFSLFAGCGGAGGGNPVKPEYPLFVGTDDTWTPSVINMPTFEIADVPEGTDIVLDNTCKDGLVLQRRAANVLTGTTTQENIAATINGETYYGYIDDGKFEIYLPPMEAGGPYEIEVICETSKVTIKDVYVGEVVLVAGQSNAAYQFSGNIAGNNTVLGDIIDSANTETIRMFEVPQTHKNYPYDKVNAEWKPTNSSTIKGFSVIGYLYAMELQKILDVPVGIICAAVGGSSLAYWMPQEDFEALSAKQQVRNDDDGSVFTASIGYNGMIAPLLKMRFKHVLWYQGESNSWPVPELYDIELETLITAYRREFNNPDMGWNIIELPRCADQSKEGWGNIRASQQRAAAKLDNVCMTVCIDLGDLKDIHPKDKSVEAYRAVKASLATFNGDEPLAYPTVKKIKYDGNKVIITLDTKGSTVSLSNNGVGFEVYSKENGWRTVKNVTLEGNVITLEAEGTLSGVRYGVQMKYLQAEYMTGPKAQLSVFNEEGLPLDQFWEKNAD